MGHVPGKEEVQTWGKKRVKGRGLKGGDEERGQSVKDGLLLEAWGASVCDAPKDQGSEDSLIFSLVWLWTNHLSSENCLNFLQDSRYIVYFREKEMRQRRREPKKEMAASSLHGY